MAIFMFSLTGLPPLAGFWGKFVLLTGALSMHATETASLVCAAGSSAWRSRP